MLPQQNLYVELGVIYLVDFALLQQHLSQARLNTYHHAAAGDDELATELYLWNVQASGAFWETICHAEIVLRNALNEALQQRHNALGRPGTWFDNPSGDLDYRAVEDIDAAIRRLRRAGAQILPGKVVAELPFGFWRFLLARRYTATLWPSIRGAFPNLPTRNRRQLEEPVTRIHKLRNRLAHHEPLLQLDLVGRFADALMIVDAVHTDLRAWVRDTSRVPDVLQRRPTGPSSP